MSANPKRKQDPVFLNCRRETFVILAGWLAFFLWVGGYCGLRGYRDPNGPLELTWGMPSWVFWGILFPWLVACVFTIWFCLGYIADDSLEPGSSSAEVGGANAPIRSAKKERSPDA